MPNRISFSLSLFPARSLAFIRSFRCISYKHWKSRDTTISFRCYCCPLSLLAVAWVHLPMLTNRKNTAKTICMRVCARVCVPSMWKNALCLYVRYISSKRYIFLRRMCLCVGMYDMCVYKRALRLYAFERILVSARTQLNCEAFIQYS